MIRELEEALALINLGMAKSFPSNITPEIEMHLKPHDFHNVIKTLYDEIEPSMIRVPGVGATDNQNAFKVNLPTGSIVFKQDVPQPRFEFAKWKPL